MPNHRRPADVSPSVMEQLPPNTAESCTIDCVGTRVDIEPVKKDIAKGKIPQLVVKKLLAWVDDVQTNGLEESRKRPGYHDEPLHGDREGQRSVRLSRQWRAIYVVRPDGTAQFVKVQEVTPHDY